MSIEILSVEDDDNLAYVIATTLQLGGFSVTRAKDGSEALRLALDNNPPDLMILDVMLPDLSGFEVCQRMREAGVNIPVIFLTAVDSVGDKVRGLTMGADDYLTKPFSPSELVARVKAVLRRSDGPAAPEVVAAGRCTIDVGRREIRVDDTPVELTTKEFDLVRFLAERSGLALSRQQILDGVWGFDWYGDPRTVDVHMAQVRKKLGDAIAITTVRGVGYRFEPAKP